MTVFIQFGDKGLVIAHGLIIEYIFDYLTEDRNICYVYLFAKALIAKLTF
jgi:hypothetical protein